MQLQRIFWVLFGLAILIAHLMSATIASNNNFLSSLSAPSAAIVFSPFFLRFALSKQLSVPEMGIWTLPFTVPANFSPELNSLQAQPSILAILASTRGMERYHDINSSATSSVTIAAETPSTVAFVTISPTFLSTFTLVSSPTSSPSGLNHNHDDDKEDDEDANSEASDSETSGSTLRNKGKGKATEEDDEADDEDSEAEAPSTRDKGKGKATEEDDEAEEDVTTEPGYTLEFEYETAPSAWHLSNDPNAAGPSTVKAIQRFHVKRINGNPEHGSPFLQLVLGESGGNLDIERMDEDAYREQVKYFQDHHDNKLFISEYDQEIVDHLSVGPPELDEDFYAGIPELFGSPTPVDDDEDIYTGLRDPFEIQRPLNELFNSSYATMTDLDLLRMGPVTDLMFASFWWTRVIIEEQNRYYSSHPFELRPQLVRGFDVNKPLYGGEMDSDEEDPLLLAPSMDLYDEEAEEFADSDPEDSNSSDSGSDSDNHE